MNPGEIWLMDTGDSRLVVSNSVYNIGTRNRVITVAVTEANAPKAGFDPFLVATTRGDIRADTVAMHPRNFLTEPLARISDEEMAQVREHLTFIFGSHG